MTDDIMIPRRRPLYTCGASTLAIVWNLYRRAIQVNGPIGSATRKLVNVCSRVSPLMCVIQYQWLETLSFVDGYFLSTENKIEKLVPQSRHVFDKIDYMVHNIDDLPMKFENVTRKLPTLIHKIPFLECVIMYAIKWLEFLTSALVIWGMDSAKEKEIGVDTNVNEHNKQSVSSFGENNSIDHNVSVVMPPMKCSYKEALKKGVNEDTTIDKKEEGNGNNVEENLSKGEQTLANENDMVDKEDPLLELFDFGWETPNTRLTMSRSASYT